MTDYRFEGRERVTIELDGFFKPTRDLPDRLEYELVEGQARVSLFAFHVDNLKVKRVPFGTSYSELLWRIAVRHAGAPAWWVTACDLEALIPTWAARRWVRYPVRWQRVNVTERQLSMRDLNFDIGPGVGTARVEQRDLLTGDLYRVPWGDDASGAQHAEVTDLTDSLGRLTVGTDITWSPTAIVRYGRMHRCGVAASV